MKWRYLFFSLGFLLFFLVLVLILLSRPLSSDSSFRPFVINQGESLVDIGQRLHQNNLIRHPLVFVFWAVITGQKNNVKAGTFEISGSWSTKTVVANLTKGGSHDYWLKIIPGQRVEEFAPIDLISAAADQEGYLFPDSYLIPDYFTPKEIVDLITQNFNQKITSLNIAPSELAPIVTLASLLEREAKTKTDKQQVAAVLLNRLRAGMPLQVDATVQYGRDSLTKPSKYWLPLTKSDLQINSPFNTYQNRGLPPSPICNPGLDSLFAAQNPLPSDNLFYISGTDGQMHFAKTLADHNRNIAKYLK